MMILEAVNIMLSVIGESPVTDILDADGNIALQILKETNKAVQTLGWNFNTENDLELAPDYQLKHIKLPLNTARIQPEDRDVVMRKGKLYDTNRHTYEFSTSQLIKIVYVFDYDDIPPSAQYYIALKSARVFQCRILNSKELLQTISFEEMDALKTLKRDDGIHGQYNMLTDNLTSINITRRH